MRPEDTAFLCAHHGFKTTMPLMTKQDLVRLVLDNPRGVQNLSDWVNDRAFHLAYEWKNITMKNPLICECMGEAFGLPEPQYRWVVDEFIAAHPDYSEEK